MSTLAKNQESSSYHLAGALQTVELDQEEDEEETHAEDLVEQEVIEDDSEDDGAYPGDGVPGDVEISGGRDTGGLLGGLEAQLLDLDERLRFSRTRRGHADEPT